MSELNIDAALVEDPEAALAAYREKSTHITDSKTVAEISSFRRRFSESHNVRISFNSEAVARIEEISREQSMSVLQLCEQMFADYQFGLKLILKNSGQEDFVLPVEAVERPDRYLSGLVVQSYRDQDLSHDDHGDQGAAAVESSTDEPDASSEESSDKAAT